MATFASTPATAAKPADSTVRPGVLTQFRKYSGSALPGFFGASAYDEVAIPAVAAAVDKTGRFDENFTDRSLRGGFSTTLALWGDATDRAAEAQRLKHLHRDVRGFGINEFADVRYSALDPVLWNWIAVSGMFLILHSFTPSTGIALLPAEQEAAYRELLKAFEILQLPGRSAGLPPTYAAAKVYYDDMVATRAQANSFLDRSVRRIGKLPLPTLLLPKSLAVAITPLWLIVRPAVGHIIKICSFGIMHPGIRQTTGFRWEARHDREFALYTRGLQLIWRLLPDRLLLVPLARNRLEYEKIVRLHRSVALDSFATPGGCPVG
ncbi:MAG: hypothetical protein QOJ80_6689 [Mycobacterium sp.]|nr:hypothetical protein [Mycobacterium sp.]